MAVVTYTALRNIIGGHTQGNSYQIEFYLGLGSQKKHNTVRKVNESISGKRETIQHRDESIHSVTATIVPVASLLTWQEFLFSVSHGEQFTIDVYGTIATPILVKNCILLNDSWNESPTSEVNDFFDINFEVKYT